MPKEKGIECRGCSHKEKSNDSFPCYTCSINGGMASNFRKEEKDNEKK